MRPVLPWSWSSYESYNTCPFQFYHLKIAKTYPWVDTPPIIWGNLVHKAIEDYAKEGKPVPETMDRFMPLVNRILDAPGDNYVELELAITIDLQPTGFWSDDAWARGKGDIIKVNGTKGFNGDWKTGKWKEASLQLDLATVMTFAQFPELEVITTAFIYFQEPSKPVSKRFTRAQVPEIMAQFAAGVRDMQYSEQMNVWPKKPSGLCKAHCPVRECEYFQKGARRW